MMFRSTFPAVPRSAPSAPHVLAPTGPFRATSASALTLAPEIADLVRDFRTKASVLREYGDARIAIAFDDCADAVAAASTDFDTWLSETEAARRAGWTPAQVRKHARMYEHTPHVSIDRQTFRMRACIVPRGAATTTLMQRAGGTSASRVPRSAATKKEHGS